MTEILHRFVEAFKSSGFPILLLTAFHASNSFAAKIEDEDQAPGDNFPNISPEIF